MNDIEELIRTKEMLASAGIGITPMTATISELICIVKVAIKDIEAKSKEIERLQDIIEKEKQGEELAISQEQLASKKKEEILPLPKYQYKLPKKPQLQKNIELQNRGEVVGVIYHVNCNNSVYENPTNEFEEAFRDGKCYTTSPMNIILEKYFSPSVIKAQRLIHIKYMKQIGYQVDERSGAGNTKQYRFYKKGQVVKDLSTEKPIFIDSIMHFGVNRRINGDTWDGFEKEFCDGEEHLLADANKMIADSIKGKSYTNVMKTRELYIAYAIKKGYTLEPEILTCSTKTFKLIPPIISTAKDEENDTVSKWGQFKGKFK